MSKKKNVICCVSLLLLILLLSQSKMLEMMINTSLGRMILLALIVLLSYMNKIAGIVGVLLVIIMFNSSNLRLRLEGFDTKDPAAVAATDDKKEDKKEDKKDSKKGKPDFLDLDKDGDKKEPMKKAAKEAKGKKDEKEETGKKDAPIKKVPLKGRIAKSQSHK